MTAKIKEIKTRQGEIQEKHNIPQEESPLHLTFEKWKDESKKWKNMPWADTREDLVGDFVRAMALELSASYEEHAPAKGIQMICASLAKINGESFHLYSKNDNLNDKFEFHIYQEPEKISEEKKTDVEFVIESGQEGLLDDKSKKKFLNDLKNEDVSHQPTFPDYLKDFVTHFSDKQLVEIISQVEPSFGKDDISILLGAASFILFWAQSKHFNAENSEISFTGLYDKDEYLAPGKKFVARGHRTELKHVFLPHRKLQ